MERELTDISFEEWVTYVFDHPVGNPDAPHWCLDNDNDSKWWDPFRQPEVTVTYLTKLFENAPRVLMFFSDAQVKEGFEFLVSNLYSLHMWVLFNADVPWSERKRCIYSIYTLFERFLASRCLSHLSHLDTIETDTSDESPHNRICYMWWDVLFLYENPEEDPDAEVNSACLNVMRMILDLDSDACRESALRGLSHWHLDYPKQVEAIIDRFLEHNPDLRYELKEYARAARRGLVL